MDALDRASSFAAGALRWSGALATELLLLPATIRSLRETVEVLASMPPEIERLASALDGTSATIEAHVPDLSRVVVKELAVTVEQLSAPVSNLVLTLEKALPDIAHVLETLPGQLASFDKVVSDVGEQLGGVLPKLETVVIDELGERVRHLDEVVSELSTTLTAVLGAIPGVRRNVGGSSARAGRSASS